MNCKSYLLVSILSSILDKLSPLYLFSPRLEQRYTHAPGQPLYSSVPGYTFAGASTPPLGTRSLVTGHIEDNAQVLLGLDKEIETGEQYNLDVFLGCSA